jgi:tetratricopeptide (TPR) repeat protein
VPHLRDAFNIRKRKLDPDSSFTLEGDLYPYACLQAGVSLRVTGRPKEAVVFLEEAVTALRKIDLNHPELPGYQTTLACAYVMSGQMDRALKLPKGPHAAFRAAVELAWRGREREVSEIAAGLLKSAEGSKDPVVCDRAAKVCCLVPADPAQLADALQLARKAMETKGKKSNAFQLTLGMVEYHNGNLESAFKTFEAVADRANDDRITGTAAYYMAMIRFREGKPDEARKLATSAAAGMKPIPQDIENQLVGDADLNDLVLWLTYNRAKKLIGFDAVPPKPPAEKEY